MYPNTRGLITTARSRYVLLASWNMANFYVGLKGPLGHSDKVDIVDFV